jgi:hypothetical protein
MIEIEEHEYADKQNDEGDGQPTDDALRVKLMQVVVGFIV